MSLSIALFGAGRIGRIHGRNIAAHPRARLAAVVDPHRESAQALARDLGCEVAGTDAVMADASIDAVVVASATDTHCELIEAAARAGKAVFCEKPVDLSLPRVDRCLAVVDETGVPCAIGFNRRFDPQFARLHAQLAAGRVGRLESVIIISRDPAPPPVGYIASSGGLFRDMTIHDFDMARWLLGVEPVTVYATGTCLVDPAIAGAGDIDTATVVLSTGDGVTATISNSRRASYGYDQRIEVFGSGGMLQAGNNTETNLVFSGEAGVVAEKPLHFFLERYAEAYRRELDTFVNGVLDGQSPGPGVGDGRQALVLAEAALLSMREGRPVAL